MEETKTVFKNPENQHEETPVTIDTNINIAFRKSTTILPHWLDKKIFNEHQAIYAPEHERFEYNLDLNDEDLKIYLGTYFPRSYSEMFCIIDNLMQNNRLLSILEHNEINVLDYGCGTGGEILGLITAIGKHLPYARINVTAIDGNEGALLILRDLVEGSQNRNLKIELTTLCQTLSSEIDLETVFKGEQKYQFVLCDKMVCELISKGVLQSNAYAIMAKTLSTILHDNGLLILLDVTTRDERTGFYYPQLMNRSINDYVRKNEIVETLIPLSCACNENCTDLCFMQQTFCISHSHKSKDESRVCYRILCRKQLKTEVMQGVNTENLVHIIHPMKYRQNDKSAICRQTKDNEKTIDSFNLNQ